MLTHLYLMAKYKLSFIVFILVIANLFCAEALQDLPIYKIDASYTINSDNSVNESINFTLGQYVNRTLNITVEHNISGISVTNTTNEFNFTMEDRGDKYVLHIPLESPQIKIALTYTNKDEVFKKDSVSLFLKNFVFNDIIQKMSVYVQLPAGAILYNGEYAPKSGEILSDGNNIFIRWNENNIVDSIAFSVKYTEPAVVSNSTITEIIIKETKAKFYAWQVIAAALVMGLAIFYFYFLKKTKKDLLTGFREDEQKVILFLQQNKETWQNKIQQTFMFSRAKVTRIVKRLEDQKLIRKENFGRTNKIHWRK